MDHKTKVLSNGMNKKLAIRMGLDKHEIEVIEELQRQRNDHYKRMHIAPLADLKAWDNVCTNLEFSLQKAWGFSQDIKYHKFWDRPRCTCPKMDNDDAYPYGYYVISESCPLHGGE